MLDQPWQGERRFYLGAVVDDLYLTTNAWVYDPPNFEGPLVRPGPDWVLSLHTVDHTFYVHLELGETAESALLRMPVGVA